MFIIAIAAFVPVIFGLNLASSGKPDIFGSTALRVSRTPLDAQWHRATALGIGSARNLVGRLLAGARPLGRREQVEAVNEWVNARIAFSEDRLLHGTGDVWSAGAETIRRGRGDCEDYAIAKMQLLRALGFSSDDLYLTIVRDLVRRADHAVLVMRLDGEFLVLDNNTDQILESRQVSDYRPVFTYSAGQTWVHGYRPAVTVPADQF